MYRVFGEPAPLIILVKEVKSCLPTATSHTSALDQAQTPRHGVKHRKKFATLWSRSFKVASSSSHPSRNLLHLWLKEKLQLAYFFFHWIGAILTNFWCYTIRTISNIYECRGNPWSYLWRRWNFYLSDSLFIFIPPVLSVWWHTQTIPVLQHMLKGNTFLFYTTMSMK